MFCSFHNIDLFKQAFQEFFTVKNILVWEKNNTSMGDLKGDFAPKIEFVLFLQSSTGVACQNLNRNFIGIELDPTYYKIAKERIESVQPTLQAA